MKRDLLGRHLSFFKRTCMRLFQLSNSRTDETITKVNQASSNSIYIGHKNNASRNDKTTVKQEKERQQ